MELQQVSPRALSRKSLDTEGEIDVLLVRLDQDPSVVCPLFETLSPDERQRAEKYRFLKDRNSYIFTRGTLRKLLAGYLNVGPDEIRFSYDACGKPRLDSECESLHFNVSHSHKLALIAVTRGREVGIDLEFIDNCFEFLKTAPCVFSSADMSRLMRLPPRSRPAAFFHGWTRKEAVLKAIGQGFSSASAQFAGPFITNKPSISFMTRAPHKARTWSLVSLPTAPGYTSALAVEGRVETIRFRYLWDETYDVAERIFEPLMTSLAEEPARSRRQCAE